MSPTRYVNGIFKGGGAKGVAYAGALRAVKERGLWFRSVTGASAGAITAALVASGMSPDEIESAVPDGLRAAKSPIPWRLIKATIGHAESLFESDGLRIWLDKTLARRIAIVRGEDPSVDSVARPVTFAALHDAFGIELYVVVMDLHTGLPIVFSRRTTPHVEVAAAVTSSSAIPGVFPPGRAAFHNDEDGAVVHQLVDGGAWANYPAFVFQDRSFRCWLHDYARSHTPWGDEEESGWVDECQRPVVGFVLGESEPLERRRPIGMIPADGLTINRRFDLGPTYTSKDRVSFIFGMLLSNDYARLCVGLALVAWAIMSVVMLPVGLRRYAAWVDSIVPDLLLPIALVGSVTILLVAAAIAIGMLAALIVAGRLIADTVVPSLKALVGVPTEVPPWIGLGPESVVLWVPCQGLTTVGFTVPTTVRQKAIATAHAGVLAQLDNEDTQYRLEELLAGRVPAERPTPRHVPQPVVGQAVVRATVAELFTTVAAAVMIGLLGWWTTNSAGVEGIWRIAGLLAVALVGIVVGLWVVSTRTGLRAAGRAGQGIAPDTRLSHVTGAVAIAVGVAALAAGLLLSRSAMDERGETTRHARVVGAEVRDGVNTYDVQWDDGEATITTQRHLRLGERIYVSDEGGGPARLSGALDDVRFGESVFAVVLGLGCLTSGLRQIRWAKRCRRLTSLVEEWKVPGVGSRPAPVPEATGTHPRGPQSSGISDLSGA